MDTSHTTPPLKKGLLSPRHKKILIAVLAAVLLALLFCVAYHVWKNTFVLSGELLVTSDALPATPAQILDLKEGTLRPVVVESAGAASVFAVVHADDTHYYLIGDANTSNVYRQTETGLEELTHSETLKLDLSYDSLSGAAAYVVPGEEGNRVMVWQPTTGEETDAGAGSNPTLLPGGFFVLIEREGELVSVHLETGNEYPLFGLTPGASYYVDPDAMEVVLYEPAGSALQVFSIASSVTGNYISATPMAAAPSHLFHARQGIVGALLDAERNVLTFVNGDDSREVPLAGTLPDSYQLSTYHD